jgi:N-acetylglucosamine-6-phosphate deacetylase
VFSDKPYARPDRVLARQLFDGISPTGITDQIIELADGKIASIHPATDVDLADPSLLSAEIVAPGFIDIQINGAGGVQFNFAPSVATLDQIASGARQGGTAHILPTFITEAGTAYQTAITAAKQAIEASVPGILGLHLEGPFLSPERPGIHDPQAIRPITPEDIAALTADFPGPLLLTLAPEQLPAGALATLSKAGVVVFAGHSAATSFVMAEAEQQGLRGTTHLFNAMSQITAREPGVVGAVLASSALFAGIIADGQHVAVENLRIAARLMPDRLCLVTDAMLTLASDTDQFTLNGQQILLQEERLTNAAGALAGAHIAMDESLRNMVKFTQLPLAAVFKMASLNPARALGLQHELGLIQPGYRASLSLLRADLKAMAVVVDGGLQFCQDA